MKLLIVSPIFPPDIGGPATYVYNLAQKLSRDHQITIICFCRSHPKPIAGVDIVAISTTGNSLTRQLNLFFRVLTQLIGHDLVYIQGSLVVGFACLFAAWLTAKPSTLKFVGDELWESARRQHSTNLNLENHYSTHLPLSVKLLMHQFTLRRVTTVVTPSNYLKNFLIKYHGVKPSNIAVISNAVQVTLAKTKKSPHKLLYVGRLVAWKNVDLTIKAVAMARRSKPWSLSIIGTGPDHQKLKRLVTKLKAKNWVKFLGNLDHSTTLTHIAQAQKLLLLSSYEGQSHLLIEAILLGTPVIASDIPPNRELVTNRSNLVNLEPSSAAQAINSKPPKSSLNPLHYSWRRHTSQLTSLFQRSIQST